MEEAHLIEVPAVIVSFRKGDDDDLYPDLNPLDDDDFVKILAKMAALLQEAAGRYEALSLRNFLDRLDVDWSKMSPEGVRRVVAAAAKAVSPSILDKIVSGTAGVFRRALRSIVPGTKRNVVEKEKLDIVVALSDADKKAGASLLRQQEAFIRDEVARRSESAQALARRITENGIARGLGANQITAQLATDITLSQLGRSRAYWEVVATSFLNRARTVTQLNAYEEAGITTYKFVAVIDEVTTDICRYMDGRVFKVSRALTLQRKAQELEDPDRIRDVMPWVTRGSEDGRDVLFYEKKGKRHRVAYVDESAVGRQDQRGLFSGGLSNEELAAAGVMVPPLHGRCRSTIVTED